MSLTPQQLPEQRMITFTIDEILHLVEHLDGDKPALENYFSPSRKEMFVKDYIHYLNSSLLEVKRGNLNLEKYIGFVLSFQFTAPLLEIPAVRELVLFYRILEERYDVEDLDTNLHFRMDSDNEIYTVFDFEDSESDKQDAASTANPLYTEEASDKLKELEKKKIIIGEEEALSSYRQELEKYYEGRREVKEIVQKRLKQDGIEAIMKWQQKKGIPELAEAFGRSIVIPSFFSFSDKKLEKFYGQNTNGISYEIAVPEFE